MATRTFTSGKILKTLFLICLVCITILSLVPDDAEAGIEIPKLTSSGFFIHAAAYLVLSILGRLAYPHSKSILVFVFCHSLVMEGLQHFVPYRSFNPLDIFANLCGVLVALFITITFQPKVRG